MALADLATIFSLAALGALLSVLLWQFQREILSRWLDRWRFD